VQKIYPQTNQAAKASRLACKLQNSTSIGVARWMFVHFVRAIMHRDLTVKSGQLAFGLCTPLMAVESQTHFLRGGYLHNHDTFWRRLYYHHIP